MTAWPIGLSTGCFYRQSILTVLDEIRSSGFHIIEICSFPQHLDYHHEGDVRRAGERIHALGLRPYSFHAPFANHIDITALDDGARQAAVGELITACRAAALLGAEHVVLHPGPEREGRPGGDEFVKRIHHAASSLRRVAACCREEGVKLLLENMLPHLLFGHTSHMLFLLGEMGADCVGVCLDTGHARLGGDLASVVHLLSGHLKLVHINDNRGDRDSHLIPGEGSIDWPWLMGELHRHQFHGGLIIEMAAEENEPTAGTLARARRGRDYLAGVLMRTEVARAEVPEPSQPGRLPPNAGTGTTP